MMLMVNQGFVRCRMTLVFVMVAAWVVSGLSICAAKDSPPNNYAPISEAQFFQLLDYSLPYLSKVKTAVDAGDYATAKVELLAAKRSRRGPVNTVNWYVRGKMSRLNWWERPMLIDPSFDTTAADKICKHIFVATLISTYPDYNMGPKIDWAAQPYDTHEWAWVLNRHTPWVFLGSAYWATGNEKYAQEFNDEVIDWVTSCPVDPGTSSWRTIEAGIRMLYSWPLSYQYFLQSPSFTSEAHYLMMRSLVDHARHLMAHPSGGNWVTMEMDGLVHMGTVFQEFKDAPTWRKFGMDRMSLEIEKQIIADGFQQELSTGYHQCVMCCFGDVFEVQAANGITVPDAYRKNMERLYDPILYGVKPSGAMPVPNDSDQDEECPNLPLSVNPEPTPNAMNMLEHGAELFKRSDMLYVATNGKKGNPPADTSHAFPYAGYYVMRSGWDANARYLFFDAGAFGAGHQHEDKLNMELQAYGKTLLFDCSSDSYSNSPYRIRCLSTEGHNTALIDGLGQNRRGLPGNNDPKITMTKQPAVWVSKPGFDYSAGVYDEGYGPKMDKSVTHHRQVLFVKPDYWLVVDDFQGDGSHQVNTLWHFRWGKYAIDKESAACMTANPGEANLLVLPASPDDLALNVVEGQKDPVAGWIAITGNTRLAAPEANYSWNGSLPRIQGWLLYPSPGLITKQPTFKMIPLDGGMTGASAFKITLPNGAVDYILLAHGMPGVKRFSGFETDAEIAVVRLNSRGKIRKSSIDGGTFVRRSLR